MRKVCYTRQAAGELDTLAKRDAKLARQLLEVIDTIRANPDRVAMVSVQGFNDVHRVRKRHYRIIFNFTDEVVEIRAIGPVESERHARCTTTSETRCFLLGEALAPSVFLARVRAHRGIGNSLHWVLDVTVNEDRQRTGEGNGAENMAMMRRMALNMAGGMAEKKKTSMRSRLERAGWNNDFLLEIIQVASCGMAEHEKIQER
ncbi:MAG: ISAs1 family transposase [Rhodobacteraceae bacterium]|nr:ISAs1 family transposase [Paracoccaceae bacterium]